MISKSQVRWSKAVLTGILAVGLWPITVSPQTAEAETVAVGPAGVDAANLALWLKAENGATADGSGKLTGWTDQVGLNKFSIPAGKFVFDPAGANFNPAVVFNGVNNMPPAADSGSYSIKDAFAVSKPVGTVAAPYNTGTWTNLFNGNNSMFDNGTGSAYILNGAAFNGNDSLILQSVSAPGGKAWTNGKLGDSKAGYNGVLPHQVVIGSRSYGAVPKNGPISELIIFKESIPAADHKKINSYLALKYGITLKADGGGSTDYVASDSTDGIDGTTMWTAANNVGYGNRITGIGRDDVGGINQKQSKSQAEGALVTVALGSQVEASNQANGNTFANNLSFFALSDNDAGNSKGSYVSSTLPEPVTGHILKKLDRVFKVEATNWQTANVTLKLDVTQDADAPVYSYYLLTSDDGTTFNTPPAEYKLNGSYEVTVSSDELKYFTFAKVYKEDLKAVVTGLKAYAEQHYTEDSWNAFATAKSNAQTTLANGNATQKEVDDARDALQAGIAGLTLKVPTAAALDGVNKTITIPFAYDVTLSNAANLKDGFTVKVGGTPLDIDSIQVGADSKSLILMFPSDSPLNASSAVTIEYVKPVGGNVTGPFAGVVGDFTLSATDPTLVELTVATPANNSTVDTGKPTFSGTATPGSQVTVTDGNGHTFTATADAVSGEWSVAPATDLPDGNYSFTVTAEKDGKTSEAVARTVTVEVPLPTMGGTVATTGTAAYGEVLTADITGISYTPNATGDVPTYQWYRGNDLIDGATGATYTLTEADIGQAISVKVSADGTHATGSVTSAATGTIAKANGPAAPDAPEADSTTNTSITLKAVEGQEYSKDNGVTWQTSPTFSELTPSTDYTFVTRVKATATHEASPASAPATVRTSTPSSGGVVVPPVVTPERIDLTSSVNSKDGGFATGTTSVSGDRSVTAGQVDLNKLNEALSQGSGQKLEIRSAQEGDLKLDGLTADTLKQLANKGASLDIGNLLAIYPVPGGKMDLNGVSKQLSAAALGDIAVHIDIKRAADTLINNAKSQAEAAGYELLVTPVELDLTFSHDDRTIQSGQLTGYAAKYIALPDGIDPNRITTGVIVNPDGSVFHVPTVVTKIDNRYFAMINDLHSRGTYSVIWNPQDFDDVRGHWGQADVNNIAARLDLAGNGDNTFSPNRNVTRSEFAQIVVTGLGLMRQNAPDSLFSDVPASIWYKDSVTIANEFGIVLGYDDGTFAGGDQITREQGIAMVARAYELITQKGQLDPAQVQAILSQYKDGTKVSGWAQECVARMIDAGIVNGYQAAELLAPKAKMTRAEVTALIARLLKTTDLIDR